MTSVGNNILTVRGLGCTPLGPHQGFLEAWGGGNSIFWDFDGSHTGGGTKVHISNVCPVGRMAPYGDHADWVVCLPLLLATALVP